MTNNKRVAVEGNLSHIREGLQQAGYNIVELDGNNVRAQGLAAVVISGADQNVMGIADVECDCPVINAHGMTPQDVAKQIERGQGRR